MKKLKERRGVTMAELLIVVAIIVALGGLSFVAVWNYQRSLGQLERDGIAKEIFVAAQNHLTALYGEGYLGITEFGEPGTAEEDSGKSVYYYTVNGDLPETSALGQMLPFGTIDETVRIGGSFLLRYQKDTGLVLDVFYCSRNGSPERFNHELGSVTNEYDVVLGLRGDANKSKRRTYEAGNNSILGWYGGEDAASLARTTLEAPSIKIVNAEKLFVEVTNPNSMKANAKLKLILTGLSSGAKKAYKLDFPVDDNRIKCKDKSFYTIILDDLTVSGMHFADIEADTASTTGNFIPGEDLEIQAVAYSLEELANIAYSATGTTNSLFGGISDTKDTAYIGNIRHLENLDKKISKLDENDGLGDKDKLRISAAEQTDSFSWLTFRNNVRRIESEIERGGGTSTGGAGESGSGSGGGEGSESGSESGAESGSESGGGAGSGGSSAGGAGLEAGFETVRIYPSEGMPTTEGCYLPIEPEYNLSYDGKNHSISDVVVRDRDQGGLFGSVSTVQAIRNLELIDFDVATTTRAGALCGKLSNATVTNVLARNSTNAAGVNISASFAGGLLGDMTGSTLRYCAASVIVQGGQVAGGLAATADGTVTGCYAGGHTAKGSYTEWLKEAGHSYDVTGGESAGGLLGVAGDVTIRDSYATCSVSGTGDGAIAGGFVGNADGATIENCYATGLVDGTTAYAFLGGGTASLSDNLYFRIVNQIPAAGGEEGETIPMQPIFGYALDADNMARVKPLDLNTESYNTFAGAFSTWNPAKRDDENHFDAKPYDAALVQYFGGRYSLRTVDELNPDADLPEGYTGEEFFVTTHYGDWPSPEVFFINTKS